MITLSNYQYTISGGAAPYSYVFTASSACVSFSNQNGMVGSAANPTAVSTISTNITLSNEACLTSSTAQLVITDANGCVRTVSVGLTNVCSSLTAQIDQRAQYQFVGSGSSTGCSSLTFDWSFDNAIFASASTTTSANSTVISLTLNGALSAYPSSTMLTLTVTDCRGCVEIVNFSVPICVPIAGNLAVNMYCPGDLSEYTSATITIPFPTGCTYTVDWSTLQFDLPSGFAVSPTSNTAVFTAPITTLPTSYAGTYSVRTVEGLRTTLGNIIFTIVPCEEQDTLVIPDAVFQIDCGAIVTDIFEINIEDSILVTQPTAVIDWSTWQLVTPPTPASPSITLTTNIDGDHIIEYEIPAVTGTDSFSWTVCDVDGNCAIASVFTILLDCATAPTANDDTDCAACEDPVTIDVLTNDLGNGSPLLINSIIIVTNPTKGTVVVPGDGTVIYTPNTGETGADSFTYTVMNSSGETSNEGTVDINIACAGEDTTILTCS